MKIIGRESAPEPKNVFVEAAAVVGKVESFGENGSCEGVLLLVCLRSSAMSVSEEVEAVAESPKERDDERFAAEAGTVAKGSAAIAPFCWYCRWIYDCFWGEVDEEALDETRD